MALLLFHRQAGTGGGALSDAQTVEHNVLGPGSIGHILRHRTINPTTYAATDKWFGYDQVGSVLHETDDSGALASRHHQDAWGNVMQSYATGLWDGSTGGASAHGRFNDDGETDGDAGILIAVDRFYSPARGTSIGANYLSMTPRWGGNDCFGACVNQAQAKYDTAVSAAHATWNADFVAATKFAAGCNLAAASFLGSCLSVCQWATVGGPSAVATCVTGCNIRYIWLAGGCDAKYIADMLIANTTFDRAMSGALSTFNLDVARCRRICPGGRPGPQTPEEEKEEAAAAAF